MTAASWDVEGVRRQMVDRPGRDAPHIAGVVVATSVLSVFGIAAALRAGRLAKEQSTGQSRYWLAFAVTMAAKWAIMLAVSAAVTAGM
ncbi:hypothetical protein JIG36_23315 [Actinoplanes sp. LDG1-06]|uniref:Uncharacterized protein n=1 Tax=Paractinoplanes ovalisporus TaxID=2810368 RepID=A0ABS2AF81_9ACTN|nr:hypothetical protein [Actinoplanes ovalisporus]MBM2618490.1 hypothetical protein [Actinoplanes ovalisporus]